jgi:hypothetical protein
MYISLPSYPSRRASLIIFNQAALSPFLFTCVLARLGDRPVEPLSTRSRPILLAPCFSQSTLPFLSLSFVLGQHFHPRSTYFRHTSLADGWPETMYWMDQRSVGIGGSRGDGSEGWEGTIEDGRASILLFHLSHVTSHSRSAIELL